MGDTLVTPGFPEAPGAAVDWPALDRRIADVVDQVQRTGQIVVPGHEPYKLQHHINPDEGRVLRDLVAQHRPKQTLEIGMGTGLSGLYICWGLARAGGGRHVAIDPFQKAEFWQGRGLALRDHVGLTPVFDWIGQPDDLALPRMVAEGRKIDFALIDGDHRFEAALLDFYYIDKLLPVGGICTIDDTDWPSVWRVVQFALLHRDYEWVAGVPVDLGPWTRPWGWKLRLRRWSTFRKQGWPMSEAMRRKPYQFVALRKTRDQLKPEQFWANFERLNH
ncbi:MAG: class I SAM-dependent methyltransferase [Phycisphaeraceae bacterium]